MAAAAGLLRGSVPSWAAAVPALSLGSDLYQSIGVRPLINCKGTFTILSGSLTLPEVKTAMLEASKHFVHIDELMEGVGKRLAELTGAESGIVTCGCAAALTHATAAAIAGGDPEKIHRLPDLTGLRNEVIAPHYSRTVYEHAIRILGATIVEVESEDGLRAAINPRTAMVMVLGGPEDTGPFGLKQVADIARQYQVPVLVDAAAEGLIIPNMHLERGADLVAYSGGKVLRGPQSAGLLLGRKDLVQAAWLNSAPHHAFGRPMKVGKEDIMGMLAAVEMWVRRDHEAEWKEWESWLDEIARRVAGVPGVSTKILQPAGLSNHRTHRATGEAKAFLRHSPRLVVEWESDRLGVTGEEVEKHLFESDPRIVLASGTGNRREGAASSVTVMPWVMQPGDAKVVADALHRLLSQPPQVATPGKPRRAEANVDGQWTMHIQFVLGSGEHRLFFEQDGEELVGTHTGEMTGGDLSGWLEGDEVHFKSSHRYEGGRFEFDFYGKVDGDAMNRTGNVGDRIC